MKITIQTTKEVDVDLPAYYRYSGGFIKVLSSDSYIKVISCNGEFMIAKLKHISATVSQVIESGLPISEEEFKEWYNKAFNHITHEAFMQASRVNEPAESIEV